MIKYILSIVILLCFASIGVAFFNDINYEEKKINPKFNLNIDTEKDKLIYTIIIDGISYTSTNKFDVKGYNINNLSINQSMTDRIINKKDIIKEMDSFSLFFNDRINKTIKNKETILDIEIRIDGMTVTR